MSLRGGEHSIAIVNSIAIESGRKYLDRRALLGLLQGADAPRLESRSGRYECSTGAPAREADFNRNKLVAVDARPRA
jgi:hypothetical protein